VAEIKGICKKHGEGMDPLWVNIRREFNLSSFSRSGGIEKRTGVAVSSLFETAIAIPLFLVGTVRCFFSSSFEKIVENSPCAYYRFCQRQSVQLAQGNENSVQVHQEAGD